MLTQLIEDHQDHETDESKNALKLWMKERDELRYVKIRKKNIYSNPLPLSFFSYRFATKNVFNKQFGSVFRTYNNPTYFSRRLFRFADIYTSNITNLLQYSVQHTFYPRRGVMPHEYSSYFM